MGGFDGRISTRKLAHTSARAWPLRSQMPSLTGKCAYRGAFTDSEDFDGQASSALGAPLFAAQQSRDESQANLGQDPVGACVEITGPRLDDRRARFQRR